MWTLIVFLGFIVAGYLIYGSYSDWQKSPVATSITTHPISELDFPMVTVCPPKDSHTALNFDLMKADNNSLREQDRNNLKNALNDIFLEPLHQEYIRLMLAVVNTGNIQKTFEGFNTFPKPVLTKRLEITMSNYYGEIHTPWFREPFVKNYYRVDRFYEFKIRISKELKKQVGSGFLMVQLDVDTRQEGGWHEEVTYSDSGPLIYREDQTYRHRLYRESKSWTEAEAHCQAQGGHLASILT